MPSEKETMGSARLAASRRGFLKTAATTTAVALGTASVPAVHAAEDNTIRLALIGCGGRGSGAAANAFEAEGGPVKLYAMADLFEKRLSTSHANLSKQYADKMDVPPERRFVGFDAYKKAIDCLKAGDVAMLCGYSGFRPAQLEYAVSRGIHVFMEKSFAVDPPQIRRVIAAGEEAKKKNLKIAAGLMCRHSVNRQELIRRIRDGQLGEILAVRTYRMHGAIAMGPKPADDAELLFQIRRPAMFYWVSGGLWAEMDIHQVDEICWVKDGWPVDAHGVGGRYWGSKDYSQNLDSYSVEWTFADGAKGYNVVRYIPNCRDDFVTYVHGTKCAAQFSGNVHAGTVHIYKDQRCSPDNIAWKAPNEPCTPWQAEWNVLLAAIRNDRPHNEAHRAACANLATIMGRAAVHMGKTIAWDAAMQSNFQFCANTDLLTAESPPPVSPDAEGRYPVPVPGSWVEL